MNQPGVRPLSLLKQVGHVARLVWAERGVYLPGTIFVVLSSVTALAYPYVIRLIIDDAIVGGQMQRLNQLTLAMVVILLVEAASTWGRDYYFGWGAERVGARVRRVVFRTLLGRTPVLRPPAPVNHDACGPTCRLSARAARSGRHDEKHRVQRLGTVLLCYTSPADAAHVARRAAAPAGDIAARAAREDPGRNVQQAHGAGAAEAVLGGVRTVELQERAERARFDGRSGGRSIRPAQGQARAALGGVSVIAGELAALLAIWVGGRLIVSGRMTTGALIAFILYALLVARGLRNASRFSAEALRAVGATRWIFDLIERKPLIALEGGERPGGLPASITFEQLRFRYPTRPDVEALKGIDLHIEPGEVVALVGPSGSGKSTLLNLALRFYDPDQGRVLVGGRDVRELDPAGCANRSPPP